MPETRKIAAMPEVCFKRILCTQEQRGTAGKRLKDLYVTKLIGTPERYLITNFSGSMVVVEGTYPFPKPTYVEEE